MNRENLELLASYLESGRLKARFHMNTFADTVNAEVIECGSIGCAIGHGPYAGMPKFEHECWDIYCARVFGLSQYHSRTNFEWRWCFSSDWIHIDDTPQGAAKRIRILLENGLPKYWHQMMTGTIPIEY